MEKSFLQSVTENLFDKYGEAVSDMKILFPNRRSVLFFNEHLSKVCSKPLWQPKFVTIDDIMCSISGLMHCDRIRSITELFKIYSTYHTAENFDTFYFWGELLLNDFDAIDKYLINADVLFRNIFELKSIDNDTSYTPEQIAVIKRFWQTFDIETQSSDEKESFLKVWKTLAPIYHTFRDNLLANGTGYTGLIHRIAAEKIEGNCYCENKKEHYAVIGFNALTKCEKKLFDYLAKNHKVDFYWDYDEYYLNKKQEAGMFIRENIERYPQSEGFEIASNFSTKKQISAIAAASDSLQCKYVAEYLNEIFAKDGSIDKNTAIVLADESLLMPVLYSLPECVTKVNVTMGYPLKQSLAYSFVERLFLLQHHIRQDKQGEYSFYHSDVEGILTNPYINSIHADGITEILNDIINEGMVYIPQTTLTRTPILDKIFTHIEQWNKLAEYVVSILDNVAEKDDLFESKTEKMLHREILALITSNLNKLTNSLDNCGIDISITTYNSMARKLLQSLRIPFSGEPLNGVQIMGILETRNLDFDNVIILSMNDDTFPANRSNDSSYIPSNLRFGYGMPTPEHHEGVYAYYFYRLIQRCKRLNLVYCSRSNDKSSGEQSRYIYQLEYESKHHIDRRDISLDVNLSSDTAISVSKSSNTCINGLNAYLTGEKVFSPSSFYSYIGCGLKFYFRYIAGIKPKDEINEDIDIPMFGTILHRTMELLYTPFLHIRNPQEGINRLIGSQSVSVAVDRAINETFYHKRNTEPDTYKGNVLMVRESVNRYVNNAVLPYDAKNAGEIIGLESHIACDFSFTDSQGKSQCVRFSGKADRLDLIDNTIRIIDYKTGSPHMKFSNTAQLFSLNPQMQTGAVLQTFLYSMMVSAMQDKGEIAGSDVCPSLYYVRNMTTAEYSPFLMGNNCTVKNYNDHKEELEDALREKLKELFDTEKSFTQYKDSNTVCNYCDFKVICNKN